MKHQLRHCIILLIAISMLGILPQGSPQSDPEIKFFVGDTALDAKDGVDAKDLAQLRIKVVPDSKSYTFHKWRLYIRRSTELGLPREGSGEELHLHNAVTQKGDVIVVEVQTLIYTDANGKRENVKITTDMKFVSIPVK